MPIPLPRLLLQEAKQGAAAAGEKKKRKQAEPAGEGGEGAGSEGKAPKKKKQKAAAEAGAAPNDKPQSIAEVARMAGQLAAAGAAPTIAVLTASSPAKKKGELVFAPDWPRGCLPPALHLGCQPTGSTPALHTLSLLPPAAWPHVHRPAAHYEMPPEVAASIQAIREVASRQPVPAPAPPAAAAPAEGGEEGGKKSRRVLPKAIKDALFSFSATFLAEVEKHSSVSAALAASLGASRRTLQAFSWSTAGGCMLYVTSSRADPVCPSAPTRPCLDRPMPANIAAVREPGSVVSRFSCVQPLVAPAES